MTEHPNISDVRSDARWTISVTASGSLITDGQFSERDGDRKIVVVPEAEVKRLREERDDLREAVPELLRQRDEARAEVERLREELGDAVDQARLFNRGGLTWREYDALLVRWEAMAQSPPSDITERDR